MKKDLGKNLLKAAVSSTPFNVSWMITDRCNYNCQFCFRQSRKKELTLSQAKKVIDRLVGVGLRKISWAGGEPLLWRGMIDLIKYSKSKGVQTMLITNGELLTKDKLKTLETCLDWLNLPLEGATSEMNELMTRKEGHFDRVIRLFEWTRGTDMKLKINTVAARQNKDDIVNMVPLIKKYGVRRWKIFQFYPVRNVAKKNRLKFELQKSDFLNIKEQVLSHFSPDECMVVFETNKDMERSYFTLAPDAEAYISHNCRDYFIGNLLKDDPAEIFEHPVLDKVKYWERSKWVIEDESKGNKGRKIERKLGRGEKRRAIYKYEKLRKG